MILALALGFASVVSAALPAPCVRRTKAGYDEPKSFAGLLRCQERARAGQAVTEAGSDAQQAEARDYLARHPERADAADENGMARLKPEVAAQKKRSAQAAAANAARLPAGDQEALQDLNDKLWKMSANGELGVTPDMAKEIVGYLQKQQGGVSVEMDGLIKSLSKDGAKLSDGSVLKLKKAARDAKGEGLDLGIADEGMEQWLLDPKTDPAAKDSDGPPVN